MFSSESASAEPLPGPSSVATPSSEPGPSRRLVDELKIVRTARALDKKHVAMLSPEQRAQLATMKDRKQVGNFNLPDAPESKKGKGKGKGKKDTRQWVPCPLSPNVPTVPPAKIQQPWEIQSQRVHETEAVAGMARQPLLTSPEPLPGKIDGTHRNLFLRLSTLYTAPTVFISETTDEEMIEGSPPHVGAIPDHWFGVSRKRHTSSDETQPGTPFQAKKRKLVFTPSTGIVQALESPINPVPVEIEFLGFTPCI
ncbi:uncharacterized protein [Maniola hyperantus]|uniref:uncharacterized protein isoform X1 n=1 Tax=Aphantopus hyperantus TaxID=2795564 RepID=UPI00374A7BE0